MFAPMRPRPMTAIRMEGCFYRYNRQRNMFCYAGAGESGSGVKSSQIAVADVGGTYARFALAEVDNERVVALSEPITVQTAHHQTFESAWAEFGRLAAPLPGAAAISIAGPVIDGR